MFFLLGFYLLINLYGFFLMRSDKQKAQRNQWRISENTLWVVAVIGGALGLTVGMNKFRHKTKHAKFKIGLPLVTVLQICLILYFCYLLR
ncbi:DUF1294 domain-containing protein [Metabacillus herbersteinensis]|uniref:DUF1294 domain-containing protein n=1 Tax=Metabacillus herbersteinensis TaxID=283816 RepID=A0ABV6GAM0_9BACI